MNKFSILASYLAMQDGLNLTQVETTDRVSGNEVQRMMTFCVTSYIVSSSHLIPYI